MEKPEIDGYLVTWPNFAPLLFRVYGSWKDAVIGECRHIFNDELDSDDVIACKLEEAGYKIRPVKLQFLDEEGKADE